MTQRKERRQFTDQFKQQMVQLFNSGNSRAEIIKEYDLTSPSFDRWVQRITG